MDRTSVTLTCQNSSTVIVNSALAPWGIGHPANTGTSALLIGFIDASGNLNFGDLRLNPGIQVDWYQPPAGAVQIFASLDPLDADCTEQPGAVAILEYDTPIC